MKLPEKYLDVNPEVREALAEGRPVVALESTIISHGMPYPQNVETALKVEQIIRENGAVPATIAILGGVAVKALDDYTKQKKEGKAPHFKAADIGLNEDKVDCWK